MGEYPVGEAGFQGPGGGCRGRLAHGITHHSKIPCSTTKVIFVSFFLENWTLFAVAIASGAMLLWPMAKGGAVGGGLTPSDAVQLMNREKALVIDVCSADEFAAGHVKGARHVPLDELASRLPTVAKNKAVPLIMVCASGARSRRAVAVARKLGYEKVHSLSGGMGAWRSASLPVEKA